MSYKYNSHYFCFNTLLSWTYLKLIGTYTLFTGTVIAPEGKTDV